MTTNITVEEQLLDMHKKESWHDIMVKTVQIYFFDVYYPGEYEAKINTNKDIKFVSTTKKYSYGCIFFYKKTISTFLDKLSPNIGIKLNAWLNLDHGDMVMGKLVVSPTLQKSSTGLNTFENNTKDSTETNTSHYPHKCKICSSPAYNGLNDCDCSNTNCINHKEKI